MRDVDNAAAPAAVQHARRLGAPFTVVVSGPSNLRLVGHILVDALCEGLKLDHVAVMSWNNGGAIKTATRIRVAQAMGHPPDLPLEEMIPGGDPELIGSVCRVLNAHTPGGCDYLQADHRRQMADEYAELIRRVNGADELDPEFRRGLRRQIDGVVRLSIAARCNGMTLLEAYRQAAADGERLPAYSFVLEVADYFREFKRQARLADLADLLAGELDPVPLCELALLEDAGAVPTLGLRALRRLLPNASFVLAGVDGEGSERVQKVFA
jgi:hypothetical protein